MFFAAQSQYNRSAKRPEPSPCLPATASRDEACGARLVTVERRHWTQIRAAHRILKSDGPVNIELGADMPQLFIVLEEVGDPLIVSTPGAQAPKPGRLAPHISLIPARTPASARSRDATYVREITIRFEGVGDARWGADVASEAAMAPRMMFFDQRILRLAELLASECAVGEDVDTLYGDSLGLALRQALGRIGRPAVEEVARGGLAPWQLKRVIEFMYANLAEGVRLEALAEIADFSLSHFSRAFKASTGLAPHRWLLDARLKQARELLLNSEIALAEIALETGFVDQPHFTRAFTRAMGEPPGAWRKMRCEPRVRADSSALAAWGARSRELRVGETAFAPA